MTSRRAFLGGVAVGAATLGLHSSIAVETTTPTTSALAPLPVPHHADPRISEVIELSRGTDGGFHVDRVAFVTREAATGTLPISADEADDLRTVIASRDFRSFEERGFRVDGKKFVYIKAMDEGTVVHAIRPGEFVSVRVTADQQLLVATSVDGMAHPRAVEALYQYARRNSLLVEHAPLVS